MKAVVNILLEIAFLPVTFEKLDSLFYYTSLYTSLYVFLVVLLFVAFFFWAKAFLWFLRGVWGSNQGLGDFATYNTNKIY